MSCFDDVPPGIIDDQEAEYRNRFSDLMEKAKRYHTAAVANGFYNEHFAEPASRLTEAYAESRAMLIIEEIGEAYSAIRKGRINPLESELTDLELIAMAWIQQKQLLYSAEMNDMSNEVIQTYRERALMDMRNFATAYETHIRGTLAEELADIAIRCYDFIGGMLDGALDVGVYYVKHLYNRGVGPFWANVRDLSKQQSKDADKGFLALSALVVFLGHDTHKYITQCNSVGATILTVGRATEVCAAAIEKTRQLAEIYAVPLDLHIFLKSEYNKTRPYKHGKQF